MSHPTTTIHLLPQEELSALLERLASSSAEHITLVVPDKSVAAQGVIGLQILADEVKKIHKELVISSDSPQIQRLAKRVGLSVAGMAEAVPEHGFVAGTDVADVGGAGPIEASAVADSPTVESGKSELPPATMPLPDGGVSQTNHPSPKTAAGPGRNGAVFGWAGLVAHLRGHGWKWLAGIAVVVLLAGGGVVYALDYYLPRATVTVYAEKQTLDRDVTVTADPSATTANSKTLTIPATAVSAKASKTQTFAATGKKDVGTKASGTVTIYNKTNQPKSLAAGTVLTSNGLQFLLKSAVSVEAATVETGVDPITLQTTTVTTPGSADAEVTAADIGDNYNLNAKSTFTVAKFDSSSYSGRNDASLTGGSKKSVKMVTASDQSDALDQLESSLGDEAVASLQTKVAAGQELLKDATKQEVTTKEYSQEAGDEADNFSLTLEITATGLAIKTEDIQAMLDTEIAAKVPEGYRLDTEHSSIENHVLSTEENGAVKLTSTYNAQVIPEVDVAAMRKAIAGKNPKVVEDYLKSQPNLHGYDITLTPKLPGPFYHLPSLESHIRIEVEVK